MSVPSGKVRSGKVTRMTASTVAATHLLTVDEYAALGEDEHGRTELMEGNLVMSPSQVPDHNVAILKIAFQLSSQLPVGYEVIPDLDVDLQLAPPDGPGTVRRPDVLVVDRQARRRVRADGGMLRASDVVIAIEILSPGSRRTDRIVKRAEYEDARIPHYWIVEIEEGSLTAHRLVGVNYEVDGPVVGGFHTDSPFPIALELADFE